MSTASHFDPSVRVMSMRDAVDVFGRAKVRWMIEAHRRQSPHARVVVLHSGPVSAADRQLVALAACGPTSVLAGLTAAELDGLSGFPAPAITVLLPLGYSPGIPTGVIVHRSSVLGQEFVHPSRAPRRTRLARSLVDACAWASSDYQARCIVAAAIQQRLVRAEDITNVLSRMPKVRRRAIIRESVIDAGGGSHSGYEIDFLKMCRAYALPMPSRQVTRRDASGKVRYSDAEFDEYNLVVEVDGSQHMNVTSWWSDMNSQNELHLEGKTMLRYPGFIVRHQPWVSAHQIQKFIDECNRKRSA